MKSLFLFSLVTTLFSVINAGTVKTIPTTTKTTTTQRSIPSCPAKYIPSCSSGYTVRSFPTTQTENGQIKCTGYYNSCVPAKTLTSTTTKTTTKPIPTTTTTTTTSGDIPSCPEINMPPCPNGSIQTYIKYSSMEKNQVVCTGYSQTCVPFHYRPTITMPTAPISTTTTTTTTQISIPSCSAKRLPLTCSSGYTTTFEPYTLKVGDEIQCTGYTDACVHTKTLPKRPITSCPPKYIPSCYPGSKVMAFPTTQMENGQIKCTGYYNSCVAETIKTTKTTKTTPNITSTTTTTTTTQTSIPSCPAKYIPSCSSGYTVSSFPTTQMKNGQTICTGYYNSCVPGKAILTSTTTKTTKNTSNTMELTSTVPGVIPSCTAKRLPSCSSGFTMTTQPYTLREGGEIKCTNYTDACIRISTIPSPTTTTKTVPTCSKQLPTIDNCLTGFAKKTVTFMSTQGNGPCTAFSQTCTPAKTISTSTTTTTTSTISTKSTKCIPQTITITEKETVTVKSTITVTVKTTSTNNPEQNCASKWAQCGGQGFNGPTCCESGSTCRKLNDYYSQCI